MGKENIKNNISTNEPIRVLHILGSAQCGGTESVVFNNYRAIDRNKIQFDIVIDDDSPCDIPKDIIDLGSHIYRISSYAKPVQYMAAIRNICKAEKYRIVHSHMNAMSVFPLFAAWLAKVPIRIAHSHSAAGGGKDFKRDLMKAILRPFSSVFATHYFACSEHAGRWLFGANNVDRKKVYILKNAIDTRQFTYNPLIRKELRQSLGLSGKFVVGHVGRFSPQKNHFFLLKVFHEICRRNNNSVLILVGGIGSAGGHIEKDLKEKICELELQSHVLFLGVREDVNLLYQAMDVFVLPSLYEGLGMACIEAQCSNLPCVLSNQVPKEVQINKNVLFLSLNEGPDRWAEVILKMNKDNGRKDYSEKVSDAGYDIYLAANNLEKKYLSYV